MAQKQKAIKVRLKHGDTARQVLDLLEKVGAKNICFVLESDFLLITEQVFLKRLKESVLNLGKDLTFVTKKKYFQEILTHHKFNVLGYEPELFADLELKNLQHFFGKVEATKNEFETKKIDFKPKISSGPVSRPQFSTKRIEDLKQEKSLRGIYFFIFLFFIGALGAVFVFIAPQAEITIKPKISTIETTQNVLIGLADASFDDADKNLPKLAGILVQTEIEDTEIFPSGGREYEVTNASGKVTIFNETEESKYLLPSRLATADGVIVRMQDEVTIPPRSEGKAGEGVVEVVADSFDEDEKPIGSRGNLDAGTEFFFPALRSETRELYYAKANKGPLVGGSTLTKYFVQETDFENAQELMAQSLGIRAVENLKAEMEKRSNREGKEYVLLEQSNLLRSEMTEYIFDETKIGEPLQTFEVGGKLVMSGIVFDQAAVVEVLSEKLGNNQDHRKKIIEVDENSILYRVLDSSNFEESRWVKLSVSLKGVETIDFEAENQFAREWQQNVKKEIMGKSADQARGILLNHPEIEEVLNFKISPFWKNSIPLLFDQIKLKVRY